MAEKHSWTTPIGDERLAQRIRDLPMDPEGAHARADELIMDELRRLGYEKTAEAFEDMDKWYA